MATQSLHKRESDLANSNRQLEILSNGIFQNGEYQNLKIKLLKQINFRLEQKNLKSYKSM